MTDVHFVVPGWIDDPTRPSGGNVYDRRLATGLGVAGWPVLLHAVGGSWPRPDGADRQALARALAGVRDGAIVLIDGLIATAAPEIVTPAARRLRLVLLVHMVAAGPVAAEAAVLSAAAAVVTTSRWARGELIARYRLGPERVFVAAPGVKAAAPAAGSAGGTRLLCVGAVAPHKGQDVLLAALAASADLTWRCTFAGPAEREFLDQLQRHAAANAITERLDFTGPLSGGELERVYAGADVLVVASRGETFGLVVTEALARALPVIATAVGGVPEALGRATDGRRPGLLVAPEDPAALAAALRAWLTDSALRETLRRAAADRRRSLPGWDVTTARVARALAAVAPEPVNGWG